MSFSDLILTVLVLAGIWCIAWVMDIDPFTKQLQVYNQTCSEMILDNTHCKGDWVDDPVITYTVDKDNNQVTPTGTTQYNNCTVIDRKNWECAINDADVKIRAMNGTVFREDEDQGPKRQITRLTWLQNKFLAKINQ